VSFSQRRERKTLPKKEEGERNRKFNGVLGEETLATTTSWLRLKTTPGLESSDPFWHPSLPIPEQPFIGHPR